MTTLNKLAYKEAEAAELLSIDRRTMLRLRQRGLIKPCYALGCLLYSRAELERFLRDGQAENFFAKP